MDDQSGRVFVVTGATSGLGLVSACDLSRAGAHVVLAVRDVERGASVASTLAAPSTVVRLDLADLTSVRECAAQIAARLGHVDVLLNNAGLMGTPRGVTVDGFEMQIGVNHLGPFVLTNRLLPILTDRVVTVSSWMHKVGHIREDDLNWRRGRYRRWRAYSQSKLANMLFAAELQRRLAAAGSDLRSLAAHPGYAATSLSTHTGNPLYRSGLRLGELFIAQSAEQGALPGLYAATEDLPAGAFVGPDALNEMRGQPTLVGRSARASDESLARRLWQLSEDLTGERFGLAETRA